MKEIRALHRAYEAAGAFTLMAMPFSNLLMSWGVMALAAVGIVDAWHRRPSRIHAQPALAETRNNRALWVIPMVFFAWQGIGMCWTEDLSQGWAVLRMQLPLVVFPLVWLNGRVDVAGWKRRWPVYFATGVAVACGVVLIRGYLGEGALKPRDWSPFISHIRFNLMIVWAWTWWTWHALSRRGPWWVPAGLGILGGWVVWKTASMTGALLLPTLSAALLVGYLRQRWADQKVRWRLGVLGCVLVLGGAAGWAWNDLRPKYPEPSDYPSHTQDGEAYVHRWNRTLRENGGFVWTCLAENELAQAWQERTGQSLTGKDDRGQNLRMTLIRYLTSVGLCKDAQGIARLSEADIARVERGIPTINEVEKRGLERRWNAIRFEYWNYVDGGNPSGHSVIQRLVFLEAGSHILRQNPVWGVGTGDLSIAFSQAYAAIGSRLSPAFQLRAHNQFLTLWLATGPVALGLWLGWLFVAVGKPRADRMHAFLFVLILSLSCLTEDTLETQAGVTFAGFFLALLSDRRVPKGSLNP